MEKEKVVLLGSGGHAKIVLDILGEMGKYRILGITTNDKNHKGHFFGYPILGDDAILQNLMKEGVIKVAIGIGGFVDNKLRKRIYSKVKALGLKVVSAIHPSAVISKSVLLGEGNVIFPGVVINPDVRIGNNVIIATGSTIDHESIIEDHVLISAGVTVGGNSIIQEGALIALGSKVVSGIKVGKHACVAAGAVVVENIGDNAKVFGIPARPK